MLTLKDYKDKERFKMDGDFYEKEVQRIFATEKFGTNHQGMNSFVLLFSEEEDGERLWVAKTLLTCRLEIPGGTKEESAHFFCTWNSFLQWMAWIACKDVFH